MRPLSSAGHRWLMAISTAPMTKCRVMRSLMLHPMTQARYSRPLACRHTSRRVWTGVRLRACFVQHGKCFGFVCAYEFAEGVESYVFHLLTLKVNFTPRYLAPAPYHALWHQPAVLNQVREFNVGGGAPTLCRWLQSSCGWRWRRQYVLRLCV